MSTTPDLDKTVRELLDSETFEPDELPAALADRGYDPDEVAAAIDRATASMQADEDSPAKRQAVTLRSRGARLLRLGIFWLVLSFGFTAYDLSQGRGASVLWMLAVFVVGAGLIGAGFRMIKRARLPRQL